MNIFVTRALLVSLIILTCCIGEANAQRRNNNNNNNNNQSSQQRQRQQQQQQRQRQQEAQKRANIQQEGRSVAYSRKEATAYIKNASARLPKLEAEVKQLQKKVSGRTSVESSTQKIKTARALHSDALDELSEAKKTSGTPDADVVDLELERRQALKAEKDVLRETEDLMRNLRKKKLLVSEMKAGVVKAKKFVSQADAHIKKLEKAVKATGGNNNKKNNNSKNNKKKR